MFCDQTHYARDFEIDTLGDIRWLRLLFQPRDLISFYLLIDYMTENENPL